MADNYKDLIVQVDAAIDPNAGEGEIKAVDHNKVLKDFIQTAGKYNGSAFLARKSSDNGTVASGNFVWNGNSMNNTGTFQVTMGKFTLDFNDVGILLETMNNGSVIRFKDFAGRSVFLRFLSYAETLDGSGNTIYNVAVQGYNTNINYIYDDLEIEVCVVEFHPNQNSGANSSWGTINGNLADQLDLSQAIQDIYDYIDSLHDLAAIPEYNSLSEATVALGINKQFRWSETNIDGVVSPRGSEIGITK